MVHSGQETVPCVVEQFPSPQPSPYAARWVAETSPSRRKKPWIAHLRPPEVDAVSGAMEKKEPKEKVDELFQKAEATNKKLGEWPIPTEDRKKLEDKYRPQIEKTMKRYFQ